MAYVAASPLRRPGAGRNQVLRRGAPIAVPRPVLSQRLALDHVRAVGFRIIQPAPPGVADVPIVLRPEDQGRFLWSNPPIVPAPPAPVYQPPAAPRSPVNLSPQPAISGTPYYFRALRRPVRSQRLALEQVRALGAPAVGTAPAVVAPSATATILQSTTQAAINQYATSAASGGGMGAAGKAAGTAAAGAGIHALAAAAATIPVYGWAAAGVIEVAGALGMGKSKGLGSGCSPDEPQLPGASGLPPVTAAQAAAYFAANSDVADYFKKCGAIWNATPQLYVAWHWANYGDGKDGKTRSSPYNYAPGESVMTAAALGVPATVAAAPATTPGLDPTSLLLLSSMTASQQQAQYNQQQLQQQQLMQQQRDADAAAAKMAADARAAELQAAVAQAAAQAQVTAASLTAQSQVIEAQKVSDAAAISAQAKIATAASTSQVEALRIAAQAAQAKAATESATTQAAAKLAADTVSGSQTRKYLLIAAVVVTAGFVTYEIVRRRRGRAAGRRAPAFA